MAMLFLGIMVIVILVIICINNSAKTRSEHLNEVFAELTHNGMSYSRSYPISNVSDIFIDDTAQKVAVRVYNSVKVIPYSIINGFELEDDGRTVVSGRIGSALVGGLVFGVAGAVIGASGSRRKDEISTGLKLRLYLADLNYPVYEIDFCEQVKKNSVAYTEAKEKANVIVGVLKYIENQMKQT